jgi:hypothetical protein
MMSDKIIKFLLLFGLVGILCGAVCGFLISILILGLYYNPETFIFFTMLVFPFFLWSFWKQFRKGRWFVIIRRFFEIFFISGFLTAMFSLEEGIITFNDFDWLITYICLAFSIIGFIIFAVILEYYNESGIYKEAEHIINGMRMSGLLPESDDKNE